ncbi:hypothetical protein LOD99_2552 [Oopsacas minuta]|uniref:Uncharacterized protein n=1 Tax=Oopsacas minuta TaxID=111878 RepID=A0AAV7K3T0_9METZ|nr:hypothetical protein LOD99_2552 [Oopsacas minuta]
MLSIILSVSLVIFYLSLSSSQTGIRVEDFGYSYGNTMSTVLVFYIELFNEGHTPVEVEVRNEECCLSIEKDDIDCQSMKLATKISRISPLGSQGSTKTIEFMFHSMYIMNREGVCTFYVIDRRHKHKEHVRIAFNTMMQNSIVCSSVDLDTERNCHPANCLLKYMGKRNFFNKNTLRCESIVECMTLSADRREIIAYYNPETNMCVSLDEGIGVVESAEEDDLPFHDDLMSENIL